MQDTSNMALSEKHLAFIDRESGIMRSLADQIKPGMPILLAYLDNREHSEQDIQNVTAIAEKYSIQFVDTTAKFKGKDIDKYSIHLLDSHPDKKSQEIFANTLFDAIQKNNIYGFTRATTNE